MDGRPFDGAWCALAVVGLSLTLACRTEEAISASAPSPRPTLLARVLDRAHPRPAVAAQVAAGALTVTSTVSLTELAPRSVAWASTSGAGNAIDAVAGALGARGAADQLELWLGQAEPAVAERIRGASLAARIAAGEVGGAADEIARIRDRERADDLRLALARAQLRRGHIEPAKTVVEQVKDRRLRDEGRAEVAGAFARAKQIQAAMGLVAAIESPFHRARAQGELAAADFARGRRRRAIRNARLIEAKLVKAQVLADLGRAAHRARRPAEAERLFRLATTTAERLGDSLLRGTALASIAGALERSGRADRAARLLERVPPENAADVVATRIARLVRRGRLAAARAALNDLATKGWVESEARAQIAELEARRGELDAALERTAGVTIPSVRYRTLGRVVALDPSAPLTPARMEAIEQALRAL